MSKKPLTTQSIDDKPEMRFAEIVWANEPIKSSDLVALAEEELSWKKSTTIRTRRKVPI